MSIIRNTSTVNIKPQTICALNIVPNTVSTVNYASSFDLDDAHQYSLFKYGAKKYGTTTYYSVGQKMPTISTEEI